MPTPEPTHRSIPLLAGGAVLAASGGQLVLSPTAWPRTPGGFARRVGDQVGFILVEESLREVTLRVTGWQQDTRPCDVHWARLAPCATARVYGAQTMDGRRRPNLPLIVGIVGGTLASLAWRPEGQATSAKAQTFVATRLAISAVAPVMMRALRESRPRVASSDRSQGK